MKKLLPCLTLVGLLVLALAGTAGAKAPTLTSLATTVAGTTPSPTGQAWLAPADRISPTVSAVTPAAGPNDIDTPVVISGTDFAAVMSGTVVLTSPTASLGSTALTNVTFVNSTTLTATVPWGMDPGAYALIVVNPDGGTATPLAGAFNVTQGIGQWNGGDLFGGGVSQILLKPGDPSTVYALANGIGLFRSEDAGEHWSFITGNVIGTPAFAIDPAHPTWLYFYQYGDEGHVGLFRSQDEGDTWTRLMSAWPDGRQPDLGLVFVSPHNPQVLFVRSAAQNFPIEGKRYPLVPGAQGLIKSTDGGASWKIVADMNGIPVQDVAFDPADPLQMVLATQSGQVFRSTDGGDHWSEVLKPPLSRISVITYDPYRPTDVWIASWLPGVVNTGAIYKSTGGAFASWQDVTPLDDPYFAPTFITFTSADSVYTNRHHSDNGGLTWQPFGPGTGEGQISFDSGDPQIGYVGDKIYGVQKTTDGGLNWQVKSQGLTAMNCTSLDVSRADPLRLYAAFGPFAGWPGVYRSYDGASNWTYVPIVGSWDVSLVCEDPFNADRLYAAAGNGLFVSTDGGGSWSALGWNLPSSSQLGTPCAMAPDPFRPGHLLVGMRGGAYGSAGQLFASSDYGVSWQPVVMPQDPASISAIAFHPDTPGLVYVTTGGTGVFRSTDSGSTWLRIDDPKQPHMQNAAGITIATHPQPMLFVGTQSSGPYRSLDGGSTWERAMVPDNSGMVTSLFLDGDSTRLYSANWSGLWSSSNAGDTWERAAGVLGRLHTTALGAATADGHAIVYAATCGGDPGVTTSTAAEALRIVLTRTTKLVDAGIYRYVQVPTPRVTLKLSGLKKGALKLGKRVTVTGKVTPATLAGGKIKLTVQKKRGHKWVTVKTVKRTIGHSGAYGWKYKPAKRGSYRLQLTIAKAVTHTAAKTTWRGFKVK